MSFLDDLPFATITFLATITVVILGYISNDLTVFEALAGLGAGGVGAGAIGHARNGAGRGLVSGR